MKKLALIIGFLFFAALGLFLMQMPDMIQAKAGPWSRNGEHARNMMAHVRSMVDKCALDKDQNIIKNTYEYTRCVGPTIREAFVKEGFPYMDKVDAYLAKREEWAKEFDENKLSEDELKQRTEDLLSELFESANTPAPAAK